MGSLREELRGLGEVILGGIIIFMLGVIAILVGMCSGMSPESQEEPPSWGRGL